MSIRTSAEHESSLPERGLTAIRVRVWFGEHVVATYAGTAEPALRYADAMERRFRGLKVTTEPLTVEDAPTCQDLPSERLWELAP